MPYYISQDNPDCAGWAVEKTDGEVVGCHSTKQDAIDQMVAVSLAEGIEPGGERDITRQVDLALPTYIRNAAAQGLRWHEEGKSGDGIVPRTVREARAMAEGNITEDKVIRVSAWAARHKPDLDATGAKPGQDGFPTPGAVAHYLWGIPTGTRYSDAVAWFDRKAEQIKAERTSNSRIRILDLKGLARASRSAGWAAVATAQAQPTANPPTTP
jgi:hypothetical protein